MIYQSFLHKEASAKIQAGLIQVFRKVNKNTLICQDRGLVKLPLGAEASLLKTILDLVFYVSSKACPSLCLKILYNKPVYVFAEF